MENMTGFWMLAAFLSFFILAGAASAVRTASGREVTTFDASLDACLVLGRRFCVMMSAAALAYIGCNALSWRLGLAYTALLLGTNALLCLVRPRMPQRTGDDSARTDPLF